MFDIESIIGKHNLPVQYSHGEIETGLPSLPDIWTGTGLGRARGVPFRDEWRAAEYEANISKKANS